MLLSHICHVWTYIVDMLQICSQYTENTKSMHVLPTNPQPVTLFIYVLFLFI